MKTTTEEHYNIVITNRKKTVEYQYIHSDGQEFTTKAKRLWICRRRKNKWIKSLDK